MTLLLDTHTFLWYIAADPRLSNPALAAIRSPVNIKLVSVVTCWEVAVLAGLGRLRFSEPTFDLLSREIPAHGMALLELTLRHATAVEALPRQQHRDPFDRMLVAQAITEQATLVSADAVLDQYAVTRLW